MLIMSNAVRLPRQSTASVRQDAQAIAGRIRVLDRAVNRVVRRDIAESGLTGPQVRVIEALYDAGPLSLKDLSGRLELNHSTVSGIVDRLAARRLLLREVDPDDRRVSRIRVTDEVSRYARTAPRRLFSPLVDALREVSPAERQQIIRTLIRLTELVGAENQAQRSRPD